MLFILTRENIFLIHADKMAPLLVGQTVSNVSLPARCWNLFRTEIPLANMPIMEFYFSFFFSFSFNNCFFFFFSHIRFDHESAFVGYLLKSVYRKCTPYNLNNSSMFDNGLQRKLRVWRGLDSFPRWRNIVWECLIVEWMMLLFDSLFFIVTADCLKSTLILQRPCANFIFFK